MKVRVPPMERSLPTSVPYRSDRIASLEADLDYKEGDDSDALMVQVGIIRALQRRDLDEQEASLRAKYAMDTPRPASRGTTDRLDIPATEQRPEGPATAMAPTQDTRAELRKLAMRLQELTGEAPNAAPPKTEADAIVLAKQLRTAVYDLEHPPAVPPSQGLKAGDRKCSHASHAKEPRFIDSRVYDFSVQKYGKPLCMEHQKA